MSIRFPTEAANADVMGEDPSDSPAANAGAANTSPYARPRPSAVDRSGRPAQGRSQGPRASTTGPSDDPRPGPGGRPLR